MPGKLIESYKNRILIEFEYVSSRKVAKTLGVKVQISLPLDVLVLHFELHNFTSKELVRRLAIL